MPIGSKEDKIRKAKSPAVMSKKIQTCQEAVQCTSPAFLAFGFLVEEWTPDFWLFDQAEKVTASSTSLSLVTLTGSKSRINN